MELDQLKIFALVARLGSFSKAALALDRLQPTISRTINELERECGGPLFYRTGRGVILSELGERVLPRVTFLLGEVDALGRDIQAAAGVPAGSVGIGLVPTATDAVAGALAAEVRAAYPDVRLHFVEGTSGHLEERLRGGDIDLAMVIRGSRKLSETEEFVRALPAYVVGPPSDPLFKPEGFRFADLHRLPLICPRCPTPWRQALENLAARNQVSLNVVIEADSLSLQKRLVRAGLGYAVMSWDAAGADATSGELGASQLVDPGLEFVFVIAHTNVRPPSIAVRAVARLLKAHAMRSARSAIVQPVV